MFTNFQQRRILLADILKQNHLEAAAFVPGPNFYYLTGLKFSLMERPTLMFVTDSGDVFAIMPELEREMWSASMHDAKTFYWQDSDGFDKAFKKCVNKANIKDFHFHDLRHLGATKLAKQGWTVLELAAQGGWKSINMVKRYANIDAEYLADKLKQK